MQHPSIFYKYVSSTTAALVLVNSRLRWSSPLLFNDVAEFQRMPRFDPTVADANKLLPELIARVVYDRATLDEGRLAPLTKILLHLVKDSVANGLKREDLLRELENEAPNADIRIEAELYKYFQALDLSKARVLCVTTEYNNDSMWINYAESHTGCVLGFMHIEELSTPLLEAQPVDYSTESPVVGSGLNFLLYGDTSELRKRTLRAVCYTKKLAWSYEREWRALTWRPNEHNKQYGDYLFYPEELESVTLGAQASQSTEVKVREIMSAKYPSVTIYRMQVRNGELTRFPLPLPDGDT